MVNYILFQVLLRRNITNWKHPELVDAQGVYLANQYKVAVCHY